MTVAERNQTQVDHPELPETRRIVVLEVRELVCADRDRLVGFEPVEQRLGKQHTRCAERRERERIRDRAALKIDALEPRHRDAASPTSS